MKKTISYTLAILLLLATISYTPKAEQVLAPNNDSKYVMLGGETFGIRMFSEGVIVIEVEKNLHGSELPSPALLAGIRKNDVIKSVDGTLLTSNEHFTELIKNAEEKPLELIIDRNGELISSELIPRYDSQGNVRAGMWIKDSAAGIGTVTYYDSETLSFGALGHGICESQTGKLIPLSYGEIAEANIMDVTKSENGKVGSLNGYFEDEILGYAKTNTKCGIFGTFEKNTEGSVIETAVKEEVKTGKAEIVCTVSGNQKASYDIRIRRLSHSGESKMVIEITDPELLSITGGIVQGMSGSPIIQNGKLVGAITHVLVNNVKCGYGIYIEDMMEAAG